MQENVLIYLDGVSRIYRIGGEEVRALDRASLRIRRGEFVSIIGPSGSAEMAKEYLKLGYYISFAGPLTFKKAPKLQEACRIVPKDRLLIETDSPYMAPEPVRGRRNEPANVRFVGLKLAELRGESPEEVAAYTTENAMRVYGMTD